MAGVKEFDTANETFTKGASNMLQGLSGMSRYKGAADEFQSADERLSSALKR